MSNWFKGRQSPRINTDGLKPPRVPLGPDEVKLKLVPGNPPNDPLEKPPGKPPAPPAAPFGGGPFFSPVSALVDYGGTSLITKADLLHPIDRKWLACWCLYTCKPVGLSKAKILTTNLITLRMPRQPEPLIVSPSDLIDRSIAYLFKLLSCFRISRIAVWVPFKGLFLIC